MYIDPIVEEIHQIRERHCQQFHYDLHQIFLDVKQREQQSRHRIVNRTANKLDDSNREKTCAVPV